MTYIPLSLCFFSPSSPINAKKVNTTTSSDSYVGLWRNYLLLCCSAACAASSASAGSVRCSPPETLASTPDSGYSIDSRVRPPRPPPAAGGPGSNALPLLFQGDKGIWLKSVLIVLVMTVVQRIPLLWIPGWSQLCI